jgi:hypothetical protein
MIAALLLDATGPGFFAADAAHCDEAANRRDEPESENAAEARAPAAFPEF